MSNEVIKVDRWVPNYKRKCCNCDQRPVVTGERDGKRVYSGDMCGVCTWGESAMRDPKKWNKS